MTHPGCLVDDLVPHLVGQHHVLANEVVLNNLVCLGTYHVAHRLIEGVHLIREMGSPVRMECGDGSIFLCKSAHLSISSLEVF